MKGSSLRRLIRHPLSTVINRVRGTLAQVSTSAPLVALTFDDGPHPRFTPKVADLLERYGARGTFFMVGEAARRYPGIVDRVVAGGHIVANHSWDHPSFPLISRRERWRQVRACARALAPYGLRLFRPPYGHLNLGAHLDLLVAGYQVVTWSVHAEDSKERDPDKMASRLIDGIRPGSIVLLHDGLFTLLDDSHADRAAMLEALERVLVWFRSQLRFVGLPELVQSGRAVRVNWYSAPQSETLRHVRRSPDYDPGPAAV
jgi:peptidoglycan/xylan/chitin deacetylase (PgdA/CDA1 family)